jgi:hypothetical protein
LRGHWHAREQIRAEIHADAPAGGLLDSGRFFNLHGTLVGFSAEWAQTFIHFY